MTYEMKLQEMQEAGYNRGKREGMLGVSSRANLNLELSP